MSVFARSRPALRHLRLPPLARTTRLHPRWSRRQPFSHTAPVLTGPRRTNDFNSGFSSSYDPTEELGRGPMFRKTRIGVPEFYPRDLKKRVDEYVVGQDRAKKTICSVIFNHYQRLRKKHQDEEKDRMAREKLQRQQFARDRDTHRNVHPVEGLHHEDPLFRRYADDPFREDEFPGHYESVHVLHQPPPEPFEDFYVHEDASLPQAVKIDKSNLLLIGPTGVGKTYILETLSKKLNVPFTISDCNSFTQAGYIGQDVEACIERLLIEANYDIKATEHGIVVLDEFDKIARRETVNGRDVSGEGVQQALLKIVEGTKVTINVKENRTSRAASPLTTSYGSSGSPGSSSSSSTAQTSPPAGKVDQYTIDTSNILFVFCGAFVGLDKHVLRRVARPSMGFGAEVRSTAVSSVTGIKNVLPLKMYAHLPHQPAFPDENSTGFTPLDLTTPADLQGFGFIPELIGRVHNICSLSPLSLDELYRILTEPRNSLVAQYTALFETYPSKLSFTRRALRAIAERAQKNETGARGLKMEMERILAEPMFEAPIDYVLITEACVKGTEKAGYWGKDGRFEVQRRMAEEDEGNPRVVDAAGSFEQFREAGHSGA